MTINLFMEKAPRVDESVRITATIQSVLAAPNTTARLELPSSAALLSGTSTFAGNIEKGRPAQFGATVKFTAPGNWTVSATAKSNVSNDEVWGDAAYIYLHVGEQSSHFGFEGTVQPTVLPGDLTAPSVITPASDASTPLQVKLEIDRVPLENQTATLSCTAQSILDAPDTTVDLILPSNVRLTSGAAHWQGSVGPGHPTTLAVSLLFYGEGDVELTCKAHRRIDAINSWGDISSVYLSIGDKQSHRGLDTRLPTVRYLGDGEGQPDLSQSNNGMIPPGNAALPAPPAVAPAKGSAAAQRERPLSPAGTLTITGRWRYLARSGSYVAANQFLVELVQADGTHLAYCYTDTDGYYACGPVTNPGAAGIRTYLRTRVNYNPYGDVVQVVRPSCGTGISCSYYADSGSYIFPDGTHDIGTFDLSGDSAGAWWLKDDLDRAWKFVWFGVGASQNPPEAAGPATVVWSYDSVDGTYYIPGGQIHLKGEDRWSHDTAIHEYGHSVMYNLYKYFPINDCPWPHFVQLVGGQNCGWTEGWADFFPLAVNADPVYHWASGAALNLETPTWGTFNWENGDQVEGRVAGALWDIFDSNNDGSDQYTDGFANIWDTFFHQSDSTFFNYWAAWLDRGHNQSQAVMSVYQNTIDYRNDILRTNIPYISRP